jgi:hypothetical protein
VFILPENLLGPYDMAFFQAIGTETGNNAMKIQNFVNGYGLADPHFAQENLEWVDDTALTCPACVPISWDIRSWLFAASGVISDAYAQPAVRGGEGEPRYGQQVIVDFNAEGVVPGAAAGKRYRFVESMGGVRKIIAMDYLDKNKVIPLAFNVSNSEDAKRLIWVAANITAPPGGTTVLLAHDAKPVAYEPGETKKQVVAATRAISGADCQRKIGLGGGGALLAGVALFGFVTFRRRTRRDGDQ